MGCGRSKAARETVVEKGTQRHGPYDANKAKGIVSVHDKTSPEKPNVGDLTQDLALDTSDSDSTASSFAKAVHRSRRALKNNIPEPSQNSNENISVGCLEDKYVLENNRIGKGHYAVVYSAIDKTTGKRVAVKKISKKVSKQDRLAVEVEILRKVKGHPNIVRLFDVYETPTEVQLVMELVNGGELFEHLISEGPYSEAEAAYHMRRIASAIDYLHSIGIVHRDLKPENLLLTSRNPRFAEVKVADFGLAKLCNVDVMQTVCGTWAYCAPEVKKKGVDYGPKVDLWSLGVIMYILLVAYHPFDPTGEADDDEMWEDIEKGNFDFNDEAWDGVSAEARDLIKNLIQVDPNKRLSARQMLQHPWLAGSDHCLTPLSPTINSDLGKIRSKYGGTRRAIPQLGAPAVEVDVLDSPETNSDGPQIEELGAPVSHQLTNT